MEPNSQDPGTTSLPNPAPSQNLATGQANGATQSLPPLPIPADLSDTAVPVATNSDASAAEHSSQIEKEWVHKAKQIIASTANDPYEQNRQLAALKAEYIQKRYNKTVKVAL